MAERRWIINASPLILLGKITKLHLLPQICQNLLIPPAVVQEVRQGSKQDVARGWLLQVEHLFLKETPQPHPIIAAWNLGQGETEVLSYAATHPGYTVVIDDLAARNCALSLGLPMQGTLGILLLAKKDGLLDSLMPEIDALRSAGMRIAPELVQKVAELADEVVLHTGPGKPK